MAEHPSRSMPRPALNRVTDRFQYERQLWCDGIRGIAGIDEAGRGPLAGPVVAAAVVLPVHWVTDGMPDDLEDLNDSKQLSEDTRERFFERLINGEDIDWSIAECDAGEIDAINILQATHRAMNRALAGLKGEIQHALVDGRPVKTLTVKQTALVKGDALSYSIAAASVLAKVTRDRRMREFDREFPGYGFADHKGYGTPKHLEAISRQGPCPIHRMTFAPLKPTQSELF